MVIIFTFFFVPVFSVLGLGLINTSVGLDSQEILEPSNYVISFTTPSGIVIGETVEFIFPAGFTNISSITSNDISISDNGATLSSVDWSLIANPSTLVVTFNTNIAAGNTLEFLIGQNVVGGVNQIVNPALSNEYLVDIQGTFSDTGLASIPILNDDTVHVSATIIGPPVSTTGNSGGSSRKRCRFLSCLFDNSSHDSLIDISGYSHHNGTVTIYSNGDYITNIIADSNGYFSTTLKNFTTGSYDISLIATDDNGLSNPVMIFPVDVTYNGVTVVENILLAPTIELYSITDFGSGHLHGDTIPFALVNIFRDDVFIKSVYADAEGHWNYNFTGLEPDRDYYYNVQAFAYGLTSNESSSALLRYEQSVDISQENQLEQIISIQDGVELSKEELCLVGDLDGNGKVSLQDLSVLSFFRGKDLRNTSFSEIENYCLDGNNTVNLQDFSIAAYYWGSLWEDISLLSPVRSLINSFN